jgi:hypothetical protein
VEFGKLGGFGADFCGYACGAEYGDCVVELVVVAVDLHDVVLV